MEAGAYIRNKIEQIGKVERYSQGEMIFTSDTIPEYLFYIRKGAILLVDSEDVGSNEIRTVSIGQFLGLPEFVSGSLYRLSAYSESESHLLRLDKNAFESLFREDVKFRTEIVKKISERFVYQNKNFE